MDERMTATKLKHLQQEWKQSWDAQSFPTNVLLQPFVDQLMHVLQQQLPIPPWAVHAALVGRNRYLRHRRRLRRLRRL